MGAIVFVSASSSATASHKRRRRMRRLRTALRMVATPVKWYGVSHLMTNAVSAWV
jgi:hypothetical protein